MAITLNNVKRGGTPRPTIDLIYAPQGMGKTTLAAGAPEPIFLQTEQGLGRLEAATFTPDGVLSTYEDFVEAIRVLAEQDHGFKTVVVDSLSWLQPLIWDRTCREFGWANIEEPGYGKGPIAAQTYWRYILEGFSYLRNARNMGVLMLCHSTVTAVKEPDIPDYDRYQPNLAKGAVDMLQQYADDVLFINTRVSLTQSDPKNKASRGLAVGSDQRFVYTTLKPTHMAKNRWNMPAFIPMPNDSPPNPFTLFSAVYKHVPYYAGMLAGAPSVAIEGARPVEDNPFAGLGEKTEEIEDSETNINVAEAAE
jgi:hypothetical protein